MRVVDQSIDKSASQAGAAGPAAGQWRPLISVLLAVRDEEDRIGDCLAALAAQDYPPDRIELLVADGASSDGTVAAVQRFAASAPFVVMVIKNPKLCSAAGFNAGLRRARGDLIAILGARAVPEPSFLSASVRALEESGADAVGGVVIGEAAGLQAETVALSLGSAFGVGGARYRYATEAGEVDTINYATYRRELFSQVGGFDERMDNVEDDEFNYRLRAAGKRLYLTPEIRCHYRVRPTLIALALQYARYGYPKIRVLRRHPRQMRPRQFVPAALVLGLAVSLLASLLPGRRSRVAGWAFRLLLASYVGAALAASIATAKQHGWRYLPLLPLAFAAMHLSYGGASLVGTIRFWLLPVVLGRAEPSDVPSFPSSPTAIQESAS